MSRYFVVSCVLLVAVVGAQGSMYTYYEDHFDGGSLNPAWTVWGTGPYTVADSTLQFVTEQGDFLNVFEQVYGPPHHLFLITPPADVTQWTAVTRVRYNTPDEYHEQVNLLAFQDHDNSVKVDYQFRVSPPRFEHNTLSEENGAASDLSYNADPGYTDFFWLRMDRNGSTYAAWASGDLTTNPDAVSWVLVGTQDNPLVNPTVGIGGWNAYPQDSGELAEFDYFRLQVVPEPAAAALALLGIVVGLQRRGW